MAGFVGVGGELVEARSLTRANLPSSLFGDGTGDPQDPAALSARAAMRIATVYACVRLLVHAATPLPVKTYRPGAERVEADGSLLARLLERPSPGSTGPALIGQILTSVLLHGDAFVGVYLDANGQPAELGLLDPAAVEVRRRGERIVYVLMSTEGVVGLDQRDVIHIRGPVSWPGALRGMSPVQQLAAAFGENKALARSAVEFAQRAPRPGLLVTLSKDVHAGQPEREALRREIEARYVGNPGTVALLGGGVDDVQPLALDSASAEFLRGREVAAVEIARAFGVPASLLDLPGGANMTYSNAESRSSDLLRYTLEAWLVAIERTISAHPIARGVIARFDRRALLRPDTAVRAQVYAQALDPQRGWMTRAEVRQAEDLPAEPEPADEPAVEIDL